MLTFQFVPYEDIRGLDSDQRIKRLLSMVKSEKIILLAGHLKSQEEAELIKRTMEAISKTFKGIEIGSISPRHANKFKEFLLRTFFGEETGFTIIGPASVIKEIKQDPGKIQLFMNEAEGKKSINKRKR